MSKEEKMEIKHCPFCGGKAYIRNTTFGDNTNYDYSISCVKGHALDCWVPSEKEAINIWNERLNNDN